MRKALICLQSLWSGIQQSNDQKLARTENNQYIQYSEMIAIMVILYLAGDFIFIVFFLYQVCVNE